MIRGIYRRMERNCTIKAEASYGVYFSQTLGRLTDSWLRTQLPSLPSSSRPPGQYRGPLRHVPLFRKMKHDSFGRTIRKRGNSRIGRGCSGYRFPFCCCTSPCLQSPPPPLTSHSFSGGSKLTIWYVLVSCELNQALQG